MPVRVGPHPCVPSHLLRHGRGYRCLLRRSWLICGPISGPGALDMDAIEVAVHQALRMVGGRMVEGILVERVLAGEEEHLRCPHCGRRMEREARRRFPVGVVGSYVWTGGGYYRCRPCRTHAIPAGSALALGALSPALSRVAALHAAQVAFGSATGSINDTLGTELAESDVYRTAEALGAVAEAEEVALNPGPGCSSWPGPVHVQTDFNLVFGNGHIALRARHDGRLSRCGRAELLAQVDPDDERVAFDLDVHVLHEAPSRSAG